MKTNSVNNFENVKASKKS